MAQSTDVPRQQVDLLIQRTKDEGPTLMVDSSQLQNLLHEVLRRRAAAQLHGKMTSYRSRKREARFK